MSATTSATTPNPAIVRAQSAIDVVQAAANDPTLKAALLSGLGAKIEEAKKNPLAILAGLVIGPMAAHYGLAIDAGTSTAIGIGLAILAGDISQWWEQRSKS